jgi:hypothetical protein
MSAALDKATKVVEVGALVELDELVLEHGIGFVSSQHPPMHLRFEYDHNANITGYTIAPAQGNDPDVTRVNFIKPGRVIERRSPIIGANKKLIIPGV